MDFSTKRQIVLLSTFLKFKKFVKNLLKENIKALHIDMCGEYKPLTQVLSDNGIMLQQMCPYTHQQNGHAERTHRHIVELGVTLLAQAFMPLSFWWDVFSTIVYFSNKLPTLILNNQAPLRKLFH